MLPFSKSPTNTIGYFRHAMALDEHRAKFSVCQWQQQDPGADQGVIDDTPGAKFRARKARVRRFFSSIFGHTSTSEKSPKHNGATASPPSESKKDKEEKSDIEQTIFSSLFDSSNISPTKTNVKEVWFMGCHADVGGGAVPNSERHMLSRIPLRWMIRQCFECETGILFTTAALAETGIDMQSVYPVYQIPKKPVVGPSPGTVERYEKGLLPELVRRVSALGGGKKVVNGVGTDEAFNDKLEIEILPEQVEDHFDALASINDQLVQARGWWILEFWPVKIRVQKRIKNEERWVKVIGMNLGRHRAIRDVEPSMHWTVQLRIGDKGYKIRNRVDKEATWGVVA